MGDHGDVDEGLAGLDRAFVIFGEAAVPVEPAEDAFDDPAIRQHMKAGMNAMDQPRAPQPLHEGSTSGDLVGRIGPDDLREFHLLLEFRQHQWAAVPILHARRSDDRRSDQPQRVHDEMQLAAVQDDRGPPASSVIGRRRVLLPASKPRAPPCSVVFTDWLSRIAAVGLGVLPTDR